jgi:8-oxo-dGTP diphosphatase
MNRKKLEVVAALIEQESKVLLCQRREKDAFGLLWEFPGGTVESGETPQGALRREIREELGIDIEVGPLIDRFNDQIPTLEINVSLYKVLGFRGEVTALECREFAFCGLKEARAKGLAPVDRKIVDYLLGKENRRHEAGL